MVLFWDYMNQIWILWYLLLHVWCFNVRCVFCCWLSLKVVKFWLWAFRSFVILSRSFGRFLDDFKFSFSSFSFLISWGYLVGVIFLGNIILQIVGKRDFWELKTIFLLFLLDIMIWNHWVKFTIGRCVIVYK